MPLLETQDPVIPICSMSQGEICVLVGDQSMQVVGGQNEPA